MNGPRARIVILGMLVILSRRLHPQLPSDEKNTWTNGPFFLGNFDGVRTALDK
jgi:hypothetical protein